MKSYVGCDLQAMLKMFGCFQYSLDDDPEYPRMTVELGERELVLDFDECGVCTDAFYVIAEWADDD